MTAAAAAPDRRRALGLAVEHGVDDFYQGVVPALVAAVASLAIRAQHDPDRRHPTTPAAPAPEDRRRFAWLTGVIMTRLVLFYGISAFLVLYLADRSGAAPTTAALALTAFTTLGAVGTLVISRITARLGRVRTLLASYVAGAIALGALLATTNPALGVVVSGVLGAALGVPVPVHTTLGQAYLSRHLGLASAVTLGLSVSAGGIASPILGAFADGHGITAAMPALLVLPVLAVLCVVPLRAPG